MKSEVCKSVGEWEDEVSKLEKLSDEIGGYKGRLAESADVLDKVMTLMDESLSWNQNLHIFAGDDQAMNDKLMAVMLDRKGKIEYIAEEIETMDEKQVKRFMAENKNLKRRKKYFERLFHDKKLKAKLK